MRVGDCAWSMQYHVELEADTVANWGEIPAYRNALEKAMGPTGMEVMRSDSDAHMSSFAAVAVAHKELRHLHPSHMIDDCGVRHLNNGPIVLR